MREGSGGWMSDENGDLQPTMPGFTGPSPPGTAPSHQPHAASEPQPLVVLSFPACRRHSHCPLLLPPSCFQNQFVPGLEKTHFCVLSTGFHRYRKGKGLNACSLIC